MKRFYKDVAVEPRQGGFQLSELFFDRHRRSADNSGQAQNSGEVRLGLNSELLAQVVHCL